MIVALPRRLRSEALPPHFDGVVESFSVAATALDYAGVDLPPEMAAPSLRPVLEGGAHARDHALTEPSPRPGPGRRAHHHRRYKLGYWGLGTTGELYDLLEDRGDPQPLGRATHTPIRRELTGAASDRMLHSMERPTPHTWACSPSMPATAWEYP